MGNRSIFCRFRWAQCAYVNLSETHPVDSRFRWVQCACVDLSTVSGATRMRRASGKQPPEQRAERGRPAASPSSSMMAPSPAPAAEPSAPVMPRPVPRSPAAQSVEKTDALVFS
eukprot:6491123-Pyramimonas_sp.AAC.1